MTSAPTLTAPTLTLTRLTLTFTASTLTLVELWKPNSPFSPLPQINPPSHKEGGPFSLVSYAYGLLAESPIQ